ncbi:reverse transcriptase [Elysia marginata]|uniref:Reverse transcriptase n=1 Tax=Elysia marginata TaxID=1093978 RepID=A0AAV4FGJ2_9GAST|nr:reverse transcriptase [Elysia marginata]
MYSKKYLLTNAKEANRLNNDLDEPDGGTEKKQLPYDEFIMVELTVPYKSRMEQAHTCKKEKYMDLTKELVESGNGAKIMPIEIGARGCARSSAYDLLRKLSVSGNK